MFVDIHSHILPNIDDGAKDEEVALEMLRMAQADGIKHIVATPHFSSEMASGFCSDNVRERCMELMRVASDNGISINVVPGAEVFLSLDILKFFEDKSLCGINGSRYILVEFSMLSLPRYAHDLLYKLQLLGFIPIIAHPERYNDVIRNFKIMREFVESGILLQINAGSLVGYFGRKSRRTAIKLVKAGLVHFVASDTHNCIGRPPELGKAAEFAAKKFGKDVAERLFYKNGLAVINDENIMI